MASVAKFIARKHVFDCRNRFSLTQRNDHAFSGSEAVSFNNNWGTVFFYIGCSRCYIGKGLVEGGRNIVSAEEVFSEGLGAF